MKNTYVLGSVAIILVVTGVACGNNGNNSTQAQMPYPPAPGQNGQRPGITANDKAANGARIDSAADEVPFKGDAVTYNANDYTHVVNPSVRPNVTGYSIVDGLEFTDAANDKLMENLRSRLAARSLTSGPVIQDSKLDPAGKINDDVKAGDQALARAITMAEMRRVDAGKFEFHVWTQDDGEVILETPNVELEEGTKKVQNMNLEAQNSEAENYKMSKAYCVTRSTNKEQACQTVVVQLVKNERDTAFIVFRNLAAKIFLGEYTSRLLATYHHDSVIDRWVEFFHDVLTYRLMTKGSFTDAQSVAELKTFAVANGVSAFTVAINRSQYGKFIVSGDLVSSLQNATTKLNLPLQRGVLSGAEDQPIDYISETVIDSTLVHANGRGMLHLAVQLANNNGLAGSVGADEGGIIYNQKGLTQSGVNASNLFMKNMEMRFKFATRNKSMRLQEKSNRTMRFTIVPVVSSVMDPAIDQKLDEKK